MFCRCIVEKSADLVLPIALMLNPSFKNYSLVTVRLRNYLNLNTSWGSFGNGENGSLKFGDTRSWYTGERGLMCMDFPDTPQLNYFDENLDRNLP